MGKTLGDIGPRARYRITIVAIRRKVPFVTEEGDTDFREETNISPESTDEINEGDVLVVIGKDEDLTQLKDL